MKEAGPKQASAGVRQSAENVFFDASEVKKHVNKVWSLAAKTPMFCKISKRDNKERRRTTRLVSNSAYAIALSAAAHNVARAVSAECEALHLPCHDEKKTAPWLPNATPGAKILLEQFLSSMAQEATYKAHAFRVASSRSKPPKMLRRAHMKAGWKATIESVFAEGPMGSGITLPMNDSFELTKPKVTKAASKKGLANGKKKAFAQEDGENYLPPDEADASLPQGKKSALEMED